MCVADNPPGQTPWEDTPRRTHHPPPPYVDPDMATAANGTHPTGMHSCFLGKFSKIIKTKQTLIVVV